MPDTKPYHDRLNELAQQYGPLRVRAFNLSDVQVDEFAWTLGDGEGIKPQQKIIFRPPIGTESEITAWLRTLDPAKPKWPGGWWSAVKYAQYYESTGRPAIHTGEDLNLSLPGDTYADSGKPVHSTAAGVVIFAGSLPTWGNVVIIEHALEAGGKVWSRYAHLARDIKVRTLQVVECRQQIASIGDYGRAGKQDDHLHFDIAVTDCMVKIPAHWPGNNLAEVRTHYTAPLPYIVKHRE